MKGLMIDAVPYYKYNNNFPNFTALRRSVGRTYVKQFETRSSK
jgi:hypothetical protein